MSRFMAGRMEGWTGWIGIGLAPAAGPTVFAVSNKSATGRLVVVCHFLNNTWWLVEEGNYFLNGFYVRTHVVQYVYPTKLDGPDLMMRGI